MTYGVKSNKPRKRLCMGSMTTMRTMSKYGRQQNSDHLAECSFAKCARAVLDEHHWYWCWASRCSSLVQGWKPSGQFSIINIYWQSRALPFFSKAAGVTLYCCSTQQRVQKKRWLCEPNPPSLCATGLHITHQCNQYQSNQSTQRVFMSFDNDSFLPQMQEFIDNDLHNRWISSPLGSLGPGRIPAGNRLAVWYLFAVSGYKQRYLNVGDTHLKNVGKLIRLYDTGPDVCDAEIWLCRYENLAADVSHEHPSQVSKLTNQLPQWHPAWVPHLAFLSSHVKRTAIRQVLGLSCKCHHQIYRGILLLFMPALATYPFHPPYQK